MILLAYLVGVFITSQLLDAYIGDIDFEALLLAKVILILLLSWVSVLGILYMIIEDYVKYGRKKK